MDIMTSLFNQEEVSRRHSLSVRAEGESVLSVLIQKLLSLKRFDDIDRATSNPEDRNRLYSEFGLLQK